MMLDMIVSYSPSPLSILSIGKNNFNFDDILQSLFFAKLTSHTRTQSCKEIIVVDTCEISLEAAEIFFSYRF